MNLNESILYFDKEKITEDRIVSHVRHYVELAKRGLSVIENDDKEAMNCLKEIRRQCLKSTSIILNLKSNQ